MERARKGTIHLKKSDTGENGAEIKRKRQVHSICISQSGLPRSVSTIFSGRNLSSSDTTRWQGKSYTEPEIRQEAQLKHLGRLLFFDSGVQGGILGCSPHISFQSRCNGSHHRTTASRALENTVEKLHSLARTLYSSTGCHLADVMIGDWLVGARSSFHQP